MNPMCHSCGGADELVEKVKELIEPWEFGQFADDFDQPLARSIRATLRELCALVKKESE